jgi:hypothetical protein
MKKWDVHVSIIEPTNILASRSSWYLLQSHVHN